PEKPTMIVWPIIRSSPSSAFAISRNAASPSGSAALKPLAQAEKPAAASSERQDRIDARVMAILTREAPRQPCWIVKKLNARIGWAVLMFARAEPMGVGHEVLFLFLETNYFIGSGSWRCSSSRPPQVPTGP